MSKYQVYADVTHKAVAEVLDSVNETMAGFGFHEKLVTEAQDMPVISVNTERDFTPEEEQKLKKLLEEKLVNFDYGPVRVLRVTRVVKEL